MRDNYAYYRDLSLRTRMLNAVRNVFKLPALERWLVHRSQGAAPSSRVAKLIPHEYAYPKGSWREVERDGFRYKLDLSNAVDHYIYFGLAEPGYAELFRRIRPDARIIDVGANIGMLTLPFARAVPQGRVVSFEPDPVNHARLLEHLSLNGITNVRAERLGVGREEKTHRLYRVLDTNAGMNRILLDDDGSSRFAYSEIRVVPFDGIWPDLGLDRVDVIKIDVEGFEMEVLRGADRTLRTFRPLLFIELDDDNLRDNGSSASELVTFLDGLGYRVMRSADRTSLGAEALLHCHLDILCVPR